MNANESGVVELFSHFADWSAEQVRFPSGEMQSNIICVRLDPIDLVYANNDHASSRLDNQSIIRLMAVFRNIAAHYVAGPRLFSYGQFTVPLRLLCNFQ